MTRISKKIHQTEQLVLAVLGQPTFEKAAAAAGMSYSTAHRISKTPEYQQELAQARRQMYEHSLAKLQNGSSAAVDTILSVMEDRRTPPASRLRAADSVLNHAAKFTELQDLSVRVGDLERLEKEKNAGPVEPAKTN
ncbi:MAG: hypothetical protein U0Q18_33620 [Bryobacteraceae bacterium]